MRSIGNPRATNRQQVTSDERRVTNLERFFTCLLYTSDAADE